MTHSKLDRNEERHVEVSRESKSHAAVAQKHDRRMLLAINVKTRQRLIDL